jgi:large subunit ribosomal protein L11
MAKKITKKLKLQIPAGKATPAPPIGPALGQAGINIGDFVNKFNTATKEMIGDIVPVVITVFEDRTYEFVLKTPPVASMILKTLGIEKGSGANKVKKAGTLTKAQVRVIAEKKMKDTNAVTVEGAMRMVEGCARSMGVDVK